MTLQRFTHNDSRRRTLSLIALAFTLSLSLLMAPTLLQAQDNDNTSGADAATSPVAAAEPAIVLPERFQLSNVRYEAQGWNNCGPATISNALSYFGYTDNQTRAARYLKPNGEDKNVSPWQMVSFVNTQLPELPDVLAVQRYGGDDITIRRLLTSGFPVIIEKGYDPEPQRLGWMGHYLLMVGYDDTAGNWITSDSYIGPATTYTYDYLEEHWQHFNYTYIVLYREADQPQVEAILGDNWDEAGNLANTYNRAVEDISIDENNAFAWNNLGSIYTMNEQYDFAEIAFDKAREIGLPWRINWYQFEMYEAYNQVGRYTDMQALANKALNDGGGQFVEESYYYAGLAQLGLGNTTSAIGNFRQALNFNPNFRPARDRLDELGV